MDDPQQRARQEEIGASPSVVGNGQEFLPGMGGRHSERFALFAGDVTRERDGGGSDIEKGELALPAGADTGDEHGAIATSRHGDADAVLTAGEPRQADG